MINTNKLIGLYQFLYAQKFSSNAFEIVTVASIQITKRILFIDEIG